MTADPSQDSADREYVIDERQALFNAATAINRLANKSNRHPKTAALLLAQAEDLRLAAVAMLDGETSTQDSAETVRLTDSEREALIERLLAEHMLRLPHVTEAEIREYHCTGCDWQSNSYRSDRKPEDQHRHQATVLAARLAAPAESGLRETLEIARRQLAYAACPTMGYVGPKTPAEFARDDARDDLVRMALVTCIHGATAALDKIRVVLGDDGDSDE